MFDITPTVSRHSGGTQSRARSTRLFRVANLARSPRRTSLTETLSVGLGLTQR